MQETRKVEVMVVIGFKSHGGGHIRIPLVVNFRNLNCTEREFIGSYGQRYGRSEGGLGNQN